jgi:hypothetical protein
MRDATELVVGYNAEDVSCAQRRANLRPLTRPCGSSERGRLIEAWVDRLEDTEERV